MADILKETYFVLLPIVATAFMGWIGTMLVKQQKERSANSRGIMLVLRYMLQRYHAEYMHKKYVTEGQYKTFEDIYNAYHDLGGNGYATHMWKDIQELEIRNDVSECVSPYAEIVLYGNDKL
mgnify:CR=1 FL=1